MVQSRFKGQFRNLKYKVRFHSNFFFTFKHFFFLFSVLRNNCHAWLSHFLLHHTKIRFFSEFSIWWVQTYILNRLDDHPNITNLARFWSEQIDQRLSKYVLNLYDIPLFVLNLGSLHRSKITHQKLSLFGHIFEDNSIQCISPIVFDSPSIN